MKKKKKSKSSLKAARTKKRVQKVFERRAEILQGFGLEAGGPRQPHYILSIRA